MRSAPGKPSPLSFATAIALLYAALAACGDGGDEDDKAVPSCSSLRPDTTGSPAQKVALQFDLSGAGTVYLWVRPDGHAVLAAGDPSHVDPSREMIEVATDPTEQGTLAFAPPISLGWGVPYYGTISVWFDELIVDARDDDGDGVADRGTLCYAGQRSETEYDYPRPAEPVHATAMGSVIPIPPLHLQHVDMRPLDERTIWFEGPATVSGEASLVRDGETIAVEVEDPERPRQVRRFLPTASLGAGEWTFVLPALADPAGREIPGGTQPITVLPYPPQADDLRFDSIPASANEYVQLVEAPSPLVSEGGGALFMEPGGEIAFTIGTGAPLRFATRGAGGSYSPAPVLRVSVGSPTLRRDFSYDHQLASTPPVQLGEIPISKLSAVKLVEIPLEDFAAERVDVRLAVDPEPAFEGGPWGGSVYGGVLLDAAP